MGVIRASNAPVGLNRGKPARASGSAPTLWARPSDWVTFTTPTSSEQKVIGLVAVWNQDSNHVALACTTSAGTYTVDWGDGTSTTHTSTVTAEKNYVFGNLSEGTLSSRGYRQAVITVTPTTVGATFSAVNLNRRHSGVFAPDATTTTNPWLDVAVAAPNATTIQFSYASGARTSTMSLCEQVNIVAHNMSSMSSVFRELRKLQSILLPTLPAVTSTSNMFLDCSSLQTVALFNTASVTNMDNMFSGCSSLQTVPLFNTASVTNMDNMFNSCFSLQTVPLFNTASVTSMNNMFSGCSSLQTVPLFNTASVTNMNNMFNSCQTLQTVPLFNTASVANMNGMFGGCSSLQTVPPFNTASVTNMTNMFSSCRLLQTVPLFNTASVTSMTTMFNGCQTLQNIPELNLRRISSNSNNNMGLGNVFSINGTANLGQAKLTENRWTQTFANCKMGVSQLNEMYTALATLNPAVTNVTSTGTVVTYTVDDIRAFVAGRTVTITGVSPVAYNLTSVTVGTVTAGAGNTGTFTVTNAATGAYVSGGVASITDNRTITVTNNPGVSGDDPTIATNKGWIVTG
jgi:surface protein